MNIPLIISCVVSSISFAAFILSILAYRMNRKLPNENKIYEEKLKAYQAIIKAYNQCSGLFLYRLDEYLEQRLKGSSKLKAMAEELNPDLDESYFELEDAVYENALMIPDDILDLIYDGLDILDQEDFLYKTETEEELEKLEEKINEQFDELVNAMRSDLAFEGLDKGLKKRIGTDTHHRGRQPARFNQA